MNDDDNQSWDWPKARWARILDRLELRQAGVGLKFWGPPLWLEVTMTGPDSERWPANPEGEESWNWQSTDTCVEAERLFDQGADDDQLVMVVGRYAVENLILNATHEIGEWLRFDGRRLLPAHLSAESSAAAEDLQGNGSVQVAVTFSTPASPTPAVPAQQPVDQIRAQGQLRRLTELAGPPSRFTYLPGTEVLYHSAGPIVRLHSHSRQATGWRSMWSAATLDAVQNDVDAETLIRFVQYDVHGALVAWEADRICRAFYVDRRRPWRLAAPGTPVGTEAAADEGKADETVMLRIAYEDQRADLDVTSAPEDDESRH